MMSMQQPPDQPTAIKPEGSAPLQEEMPFAIVQGEPYTAMPRDLYIPPDALEVFLEEIGRASCRERV